jgi:hypothetical protein
VLCAKDKPCVFIQTKLLAVSSVVSVGTLKEFSGKQRSLSLILVPTSGGTIGTTTQTTEGGAIVDGGIGELTLRRCAQCSERFAKHAIRSQLLFRLGLASMSKMQVRMPPSFTHRIQTILTSRVSLPVLTGEALCFDQNWSPCCLNSSWKLVVHKPSIQTARVILQQLGQCIGYMLAGLAFHFEPHDETFRRPSGVLPGRSHPLTSEVFCSKKRSQAPSLGNSYVSVAWFGPSLATSHG